MYQKKELFSSLNKMVKSTIKFGNNTNIPILGKGQITIKLKDGSQNFIYDVFYTLGLHLNLLSMRQRSEKVFNMKIYQGYCTLIDKNGRFVAKVKMTHDRLFPLKIHHEKLSCLSSVIPNDYWLSPRLLHFDLFYFFELNYLSRK